MASSQTHLEAARTAHVSLRLNILSYSHPPMRDKWCLNENETSTDDMSSGTSTKLLGASEE